MTTLDASKATKLNLLDFSSVQMRTFWITALAFFLCFFAWFGIVPFMPQVVKDIGLTPTQKWNSIIAAISGTVFARLLIGKLCDKYGPRLCYTYLLLLGAIPVIALGFVQTPTQFILCRLLIGFIGASFVITQVHTSLMFAPNIVGTANATSAGWGNLGGGANRLGMPIIAGMVIFLGVDESIAWRASMIVAGSVCFLMGIMYYFFTQDTPLGNYKEIKDLLPVKKDEGTFTLAIKDYRVWILFLVYAACFGIELTVYGVMDDYLQNTFDLSRTLAGTLVASFALMNIFARTLGGVVGDKASKKSGLRGKVIVLAGILLVEGIVLIFFSQIAVFAIAIGVLIAFSLSVQMAEGATFTVVPFINKKATGAISGIVGAGGNVGAFAAGMLLKGFSAPAEKIAKSATEGQAQDIIDKAIAKASSGAVSEAFLVIGGGIVVIALLSLLIKFSKEDENALKVAESKITTKEAI